MAEALNPYRQWLGLDTDDEELNHYELLGLTLFENDGNTIHRAADRVLAQVRSCRPGSAAVAWAQLLDELAQAKACLCDPCQKSTYDALLRSQRDAESSANAPEPPQAEQPSEVAPVNQLPDLFPPGMEPQTPESAHAQPRRNPHTSSSVPAQPTRSSSCNVPTTPTAGPLSSTSPSTPKRPPAAPTTDVARSGQLLSDPYQEGDLRGARLTESVPVAPVNAHVAAPSEPKPSLLPIAVSVMAVVIVITLLVAFLALRDTVGGAESAAPLNHTPPGPTSLPVQLPAGSENVTHESLQGMRAPATSPAGSTGHVQPRGKIDSGPVATNKDFPRGTATLSMQPESSQQSVTIDQQGTRAVLPTDPPVDATGGQPPLAKRIPSQKELAQLSRALTAVHTALEDHDFARADQELQNAAKLAVLPTHQAMVARLKRLTGYTVGFWDTVSAATRRFQGAEELTIGSEGLVVLVVESGADSITVRKGGRNLRYSVTKMPPGLALAIAKTQLAANAPEGLLQLGAGLATVADRQPIHVDEARKYWLQAQNAGADVADLLLTLTDNYAFTP